MAAGPPRLLRDEPHPASESGEASRGRHDGRSGTHQPTREGALCEGGLQGKKVNANPYLFVCLFICLVVCFACFAYFVCMLACFLARSFVRSFVCSVVNK